MNIALALASDRMRGITIDSRQWTTDRQRPPADDQDPSGDGPGVVERILNGDVSDSTRATIDKATTAAQMAALTLGSPEFQKR